MARWTCPRCDREFGRANQAHTCVPGNTVDDSFRGQPPEYREMYDTLVAHVRRLGDVHEDAVRIGVFLVAERKLAEVRPKARSLELWLLLPSRSEHPRCSRVLDVSSNRVAQVFRLRHPDDLDDDLLNLVTRAYDDAS